MGVGAYEHVQEQAFVFLGHRMPFDENKITTSLNRNDALKMCQQLGCQIKMSGGGDHIVSHPILVPDKAAVPCSLGRKDSSRALVVLLRAVYAATMEYRESHPDEVEKMPEATVHRAGPRIVSRPPAPPPAPVREERISGHHVAKHFGQISAWLHYATCCQLGGASHQYVGFADCSSKNCRDNRRMLSAISGIEEDREEALRELDRVQSDADEQIKAIRAEADLKIAEALETAEAMVEEIRNEGKPKLEQGGDTGNAWFWRFIKELDLEWRGAPQVLTRCKMVLEEAFRRDDLRETVRSCILDLDFSRLHGFMTTHVAEGNVRASIGASAWATIKDNLARMKRKRQV